MMELLHTPRSDNLDAFSLLDPEVAKSFEKSFHFASGMPLAHSIVQALKNENRDVAYNAVQKISHAAWDLIEMIPNKGIKIHAIVFPCIIVEAPLFAARYDSVANKISIEEIHYGRVSWQGCRFGTNVDVVQARSVDQYAKAVHDSFKAIIPALKSMLRQSPDNR